MNATVHWHPASAGQVKCHHVISSRHQLASLTRLVERLPVCQQHQHVRRARSQVSSEAAAQADAAAGQEPSPKGRRKPQAQQQQAMQIHQPADNQSEQALEAELELQEKEFELSVDDIVAMQYEMPSDEQLEKDVQELLEQEEQELESASKQPAVQGAQQQPDGGSFPAPASRKAAVLLEIITAAAGSNLDEKIAQFSDDIDEELLQLLRTRIQAVSKVDPRAADQLEELEAILRVVYNRANASPALRLLDDVLDMLGDDMTDSQAYAARRMEVASRLREAFSGGTSPGVDIFAAAAALAEAGPLAAAELASEAVDAGQFIAETTAMLEDTRESQSKLAAELERADKEIKYLQKNKPEMLRTAQATAFMQQLAQAQRAHTARAEALSQLKDVLAIARTVASERRTDFADEFE